MPKYLNKNLSLKFGLPIFIVKQHIRRVYCRVHKRCARLKKSKKVTELSKMSNIGVQDTIYLILKEHIVLNYKGIKSFTEIILTHNEGIKSKYDCIEKKKNN
jgi:hypothetical protein